MVSSSSAAICSVTPGATRDADVHASLFHLSGGRICRVGRALRLICSTGKALLHELLALSGILYVRGQRKGTQACVTTHVQSRSVNSRVYSGQDRANGTDRARGTEKEGKQNLIAGARVETPSAARGPGASSTRRPSELSASRPAIRHSATRLRLLISPG
jgi:hypothetical protein